MDSNEPILNPEPEYACPHCQAPAKAGDAFCPRCGKAYHAQAAMHPAYNQAPMPMVQAGPKTNTLAILSLVFSLVWLCGLGSIAAVILGFMARKQIKESNGMETGDVLAIVGIVFGILGILSLVATIALMIVGSVASDPGSTYDNYAHLLFR